MGQPADSASPRRAHHSEQINDISSGHTHPRPLLSLDPEPWSGDFGMRHARMEAVACASGSPTKRDARAPPPPLPSSPPHGAAVTAARTACCARPLRSTRRTHSLSPSAPRSRSRTPGRRQHWPSTGSFPACHPRLPPPRCARVRPLRLAAPRESSYRSTLHLVGIPHAY